MRPGRACSKIKPDTALSVALLALAFCSARCSLRSLCCSFLARCFFADFLAAARFFHERTVARKREQRNQLLDIADTISRMKKTFLMLALLAALGLQHVSAQRILPTLNLISVDENGPTFTVTAGSDPIPQSFSILISDIASGDLINTDKFHATGDCTEFALEAFETSPEFTITADPALNEDECQEPRNLNVIACGVDTGYTLHVRHSKTRAQAVIVNIPCE